MLHLLISFCFIIQAPKCQAEVSLADDPGLFPGHLEPLGSKRPQHGVATLEEFPDPEGNRLIYNHH